MTLGRKDVSVTRTNCGADVFRLAGFLRDDNLIGHNGSFRRTDSTAAKREHIANEIAPEAVSNSPSLRIPGVTPPCDLTRGPAQPGRVVEHMLAKVGVEGSNPFLSAKILSAGVHRRPWTPQKALNFRTK